MTTTIRLNGEIYLLRDDPVYVAGGVVLPLFGGADLFVPGYWRIAGSGS